MKSLVTLLILCALIPVTIIGTILIIDMLATPLVLEQHASSGGRGW